MAEWPCCHDPLRFSPVSLRFVPPLSDPPNLIKNSLPRSARRLKPPAQHAKPPWQHKAAGALAACPSQAQGLGSTARPWGLASALAACLVHAKALSARPRGLPSLLVHAKAFASMPVGGCRRLGLGSTFAACLGLGSTPMALVARPWPCLGLGCMPWPWLHAHGLGSKPMGAALALAARPWP